LLRIFFLAELTALFLLLTEAWQFGHGSHWLG
jgi:hypothetical protein